MEISGPIGTGVYACRDFQSAGTGFADTFQCLGHVEGAACRVEVVDMYSAPCQVRQPDRFVYSQQFFIAAGITCVQEKRPFVFPGEMGIGQELFPGCVRVIFRAVGDAQCAFFQAAFDGFQATCQYRIFIPEVHYFSGNTPVDVVFFPAEMTVIIACMCCSAVHLQGCCDTVAQFVFFECEESPFGISGIVGQDIDKAGRDDSSAHVDHIMARDRRLAHYQSASRSYADVAATPSSVDIGLSSTQYILHFRTCYFYRGRPEGIRAQCGCC